MRQTFKKEDRRSQILMAVATLFVVLAAVAIIVLVATAQIPTAAKTGFGIFFAVAIGALCVAERAPMGYCYAVEIINEKFVVSLRDDVYEADISFDLASMTWEQRMSGLNNRHELVISDDYGAMLVVPYNLDFYIMVRKVIDENKKDLNIEDV